MRSVAQSFIVAVLGLDRARRLDLCHVGEDHPLKSATSTSVDEWAEFAHLPGVRACMRALRCVCVHVCARGGRVCAPSGQKFHDFDEVRRQIEAETDRLAGTNKGT